MTRAWHFVGKRLRDGRPVPKDGVWLTHTGPLKLCRSGLHASVHPLDALHYAPGNTLCLVECAGKIIHGIEKLVCSRRRIVARMDATEMLRYFARMQALSVVHLWDAPEAVLDYLMTGEGAGAAMYAAWVTERGAAHAAAHAAASVAASVCVCAAKAADGAAVWAENASANTAPLADFDALVRECFEGVL